MAEPWAPSPATALPGRAVTAAAAFAFSAVCVILTIKKVSIVTTP
jgi:hypothetical protein